MPPAPSMHPWWRTILRAEHSKARAATAASSFHNFSAAWLRRLPGKTSCTADDLRTGFQNAHAFARAGLARPVEGTILTVLGDVARALEMPRPRGPLPFSAALERAVDAAKESVTRSPFLLAVLRESGVVDAGAQGLFFILEGALRAVSSDGPSTGVRKWSATPVPADSTAARPTTGWLSDAFCTGLIVEGTDLSADDIRCALEPKGSSLIVAGNGGAVRIHIHTTDPDSVLAFARSLGTISRIEVEALPETGGGGDASLAVLAIVPDEGFIEIFRGLGAHTLPRPSSSGSADADDILSSVRRLAASRVIILPNSEAGIASAEDAARAVDKEAVVVPTRTIPQGIAAAVALRHDEGLERNASLMRTAMDAVRTFEISWNASGGDGAPGPVSASLDGREAARFDTPVGALENLISRIDMSSAEIVTIYVGAGVEPETVERICARFLARHRSLSIERVESRQARPQLVIGVE